MNQHKRYYWIDVLRSIAIIIVVLWHQVEHVVDGWIIYSVFTAPIMIPLFFVISGYLLKQEESVYLFAKRIIFSYVIPWLLLPLIPVILEGVVKGSVLYILDYYRKILIGEKIWFMPVMIGSIIIYYIIQKIVRNNSGGYSAIDNCFHHRKYFNLCTKCECAAI